MKDRRAAQRGWRSVKVGGAPTSYLEVGTGPTLVFLHGWGLDYASYRPGLARLADLGVRVLAPAMPALLRSSGTTTSRSSGTRPGSSPSWTPWASTSRSPWSGTPSAAASGSCSPTTRPNGSAS
jgi:pimeloyl-ACP methyl ester carboxylesterase